MNSCWISAFEESESIHPRPETKETIKTTEDATSYGLTITKGPSVFKIGNSTMSISISDIGFFKFADHVRINLKAPIVSVLHASTRAGLWDVSICTQNIPRVRINFKIPFFNKNN